MAASITPPDDFQQCVLRADSYPENLLKKSTTMYRSTLKSYHQRFDEVESDLCLMSGKDDIENIFEVCFRDLNSAKGKSVDKINAHSPETVATWLGIDLCTGLANSGQQLLRFKKVDPSSRFIYMYAENSRDQLKITREALTLIFTFHQVMPVYLDFVLIFGAQSDPRDLRFSGFREQTFLRPTVRGPQLPMLGRSGCHFSLCYNLKGVSCKKKDLDNVKLHEWSIRQAAFYHQFDVVFGTALWIVTKGRLDIYERYKELTGKDGRPEDKSFGSLDACFRSSLVVHILYCSWSTENWRWYIRWLENVIDAESSMAVYGPRGPGYAHRQYKPFHLQDMQYWQDKTNEAVMVLESNVEVMGSLKRFYASLIANDAFPKDIKVKCKDDTDSFIGHVGELINDFKMQISRARLLANIISDRKELILQHLQGQAAERTEQLNRNLEREAVVMRIITIVTLFYLPATFVSTFFSTDVVKYQNQGEGNNGTFSPVALTRWLQVTLPLTALTIFGAWFTYQFAEASRMRSENNNTAANKTTVTPIFRRYFMSASSQLSGPSWSLPHALSWKKSPTLPYARSKKDAG